MNEKLTELSKGLKIKIPEAVMDVVVKFILPIVAKDGKFEPKKLEVVKPTKRDPVILYKKKVIAWFM